MKKIIYLACLLMPAMCMAQDGTTTTTQQTTTTVPGATINMNISGMPATTTQQTTITTTTTTTTTDGTAPAPAAVPANMPQAAAPASTGCVYPMAHDDYESAKSSITAKDFEDTKLTLAKQISGGNCMSAGQIRGIMQLFTFEQSKLDFAKFAYNHCCDKSNYFKVNDVFTFDNSSKELNDYISTQH